MSSLNKLLCKALCFTLALAACRSGSDKESANGHTPNDKAITWVEGPAGKLCTYTVGSGSVPIVFVHSLAGEWQQWLHQLYHLGEDRQTIAFDMRGHGRSVRGTELAYDHEGMVADLAALVEHFGLKRFVLVGHSFGGSVCAAYAGAHPDQVAGLLFVDTAGDQRQAPKEQVQQFIAQVESEKYPDVMLTYWNQLLVHSQEEVKKRVISAMQATQKEAITGAVKSMQKFDIVSALNNYSGPMLAIISDLNQQPYSLHHVVPNLPHKMMSGTGHWLQMDRPEEFNEMMDAFLLKIEKQ
ncbi:MAG: alpha/beta fold hydrolase [bacterium]